MKAKAKKTAQRKKTAKAGRANSGRRAENNGPNDSAIALLMQDHREVQKIFKRFRQLMKEEGNDDEKARLVKQACDMLTIHAEIEEEVFYPAMRRVVKDEEVMDEALVEHDGAKALIAQLREMEPGDNLYDAKFVVLGEQVNHHIAEEEGKIFPQAKKAGIDLVDLGREMKDLKEEREQENMDGGSRRRRNVDAYSGEDRYYGGTREDRDDRSGRGQY